jgi:AraC-like DNA-binding protein
LSDALEDPAFPVQLATSTPRDTFGLISHLALSSPNIGAAAESLARYANVFWDHQPFKLEVRGQRAHLTFASYPKSVRTAEFFVSVALHQARQVATDPLEDVEVSFAHGCTRSRDACGRAFGREARFNQRESGYSVPLRALGIPLETRQPNLHAILSRVARQHQPPPLGRARVGVDLGARGRVAEALDELGMSATLPQLARRLLVSPRALQRQLLESGTTFRQELTWARMRRAKRVLVETDRSVTSIAEELGYSCAQSLARAFRLTTGRSPSHCRAERQSD